MDQHPVRFFVFDVFSRGNTNDQDVVEFKTRFGIITVCHWARGGRIRDAARLLGEKTSVQIIDSEEAHQSFHHGDWKHYQQAVQALTKAPKAYVGFPSRIYYERSVVDEIANRYRTDFYRCVNCYQTFGKRRKLGKLIDGQYYCTARCLTQRVEHERYLEALQQEREEAVRRKQEVRQQREEEWQWLQKGKRLLAQVRKHLQSEARAARQSPPRASEPDMTSPTL